MFAVVCMCVWRDAGVPGFEKELEAADAAIVAQMEDEKQRVEKLKTDITRLLDQLQVFWQKCRPLPSEICIAVVSTCASL